MKETYQNVLAHLYGIPIRGNILPKYEFNPEND